MLAESLECGQVEIKNMKLGVCFQNLLSVANCQAEMKNIKVAICVQNLLSAARLK